MSYGFDSDIYLELDEADPGLDVDAGIPHGGVQPEVLDIAEEAEQHDHLVLGRDVGHLDCERAILGKVP